MSGPALDLPVSPDALVPVATPAAPLDTIAIVVLALVIAAAAAAAIVRSRRRAATRHEPEALRLARRLGLSGRAARLVLRVGRTAGLPTGGGLLVSEGCFDESVRAYGGSGIERAALADIRARLFGSASPAWSEPAPHA